ncbi:hypothetical protein [Agromyces mariniharenae]|uniref:Uncharacterized protein n=1 Tax=Agromyces mariniharenae TaxID=2604423 RepID=A0A5S4V0V9_9MICO|nr:hypothetical protein [Agromyces mariniharenae]TYL52824.1 hypothetical protein FYC51_03545 [Agromyces mariniharenae]
MRASETNTATTETTMNATSTDAAASASGSPRPRAWFIVLLVVVGVITGGGLLLGGAALGGLDATTPMTAVGIATLCYVAAAATGIRWMAWAWAGLGSVLVVGAELLDVPRWIVLAAVGAVFLVVGLVRRPRVTVPQGIAMVAYFGVAIAALFLAPRLGLVIAGVALAAHAGWDLVHYRRDAVVNRSLALWCLGLDVFLGGACVVLAIVG